MPNLPRSNDGSLASYAWPGGYPVYYVCEDDGCTFIACADCAQAMTETVRIVKADINWEDDCLYCEDCAKPIECAYL